MTRESGVRAGQLLGAAGLGSEQAVDAFVVAVANLLDGAVIATVDKDFMERLGQFATNVQVEEI